MNKVKLLLDDLQVESFAVEAGAAESGTVHGRQAGTESRAITMCFTLCCKTANRTECPGEDTCVQSCYWSCFYTECPEEYTCETWDPGCAGAG